MTDTENLLRAVRFERPDHIPVRVSINNACWNHYPRETLFELMAEHPLLFPGFNPDAIPPQPIYAPFRIAGKPYTDSWGCVWETVEDGITGTVVKHALPTWDDFDSYIPPSPDEHNGWGTIDWELEAIFLDGATETGRLRRGGLRHGHTFLTLSYIRGYENLLFDMVDGEPCLWQLIEMVEAFNAGLVRRYLDLGVDWMSYPEDLGMQRGPILSPKQFRTYIKPTYQRLMQPARDANCVIHMHSDGDIRTLAGDLLDCGVDILNLQDLVNGLDWIRDNLKGRVCIDLDIDRQQITRFGTPAQIDAHICEAVENLGSKDGGLMLGHGLMPDIPLENVKALMDAMERYCQ